MNHVLVHAAITILILGASATAVGWALSNYVEAVPLRPARWVFWSGLCTLIVGVLLYIWPLLFMFAFHPA